jgi:hypothetical protein
MDLFHSLFIIVLVVLISVYIFILFKNNLLFKKNNEKIISLLDHKSSILFEILEIVILIIVIFILYKQKQYVLLLFFGLALLEHINQILFCYRQSLNSLQLVTILLYFVFIIYAYNKKCNWVIPLFIIGIIIHAISIYYNKSFSGIVCIT